MVDILFDWTLRVRDTSRKCGEHLVFQIICNRLSRSSRATMSKGRSWAEAPSKYRTTPSAIVGLAATASTARA